MPLIGESEYISFLLQENRMNKFSFIVCFFVTIIFSSCDNYFKNDYHDNSPTSGKLKVYHTEGLAPHVQNHSATFESQYPGAQVECIQANESDCLLALLNDSCKAIIITRLLGETEIKAFAQKQLSPRYSPLAKTGIALIASKKLKLDKLTVDQVKKLLADELIIEDSLKNKIKLSAIIDNKNSDVARFLLDSLIHQNQFGPNCFATGNCTELIEKISVAENAIGFFDFAWLSDKDDELYKKYSNFIRFIPIGKTDTLFVEPNQSSFKTGEYPFTRTVYILRKGEDFSLGQGLETFMAGPKGQLIFLKQGLLPYKQGERIIEVNMDPNK